MIKCERKICDISRGSTSAVLIEKLKLSRFHGSKYVPTLLCPDQLQIGAELSIEILNIWDDARL